MVSCFFGIFLTFRLFFTLTSGPLSASSSLTVLDRVFRGIEAYISALYSSHAILTCLLTPQCLDLLNKHLSLSLTGLCAPLSYS